MLSPDTTPVLPLPQLLNIFRVTIMIGEQSEALFLGAFVVVLVAFISTAFYQSYRDCRSHIPGPWYARFTGFPIFLAGLGGRQVHYIHELHRRFGPIVRTSPAEVSFQDIQSFKTIHKVGGNFTKDASYNYMNASFGQHASVFNIRDPKAHAERRKLFSKAMSTNALRADWQEVVSERASLAVAKMHNELHDFGRTDVAKWLRLLASDITAWLCFGASFACLEMGEKVPYMKAIEAVPLAAFLHVYVPPWLYTLLACCPWPSNVRLIFDVPKLLMSQGAIAVAVARRQVTNGTSIFADAVYQSRQEGTEFNDVDIETEAATFISAGTETTADTLHCLIWSVLRQPILKHQLEDEVGQVEELSDAKLEALPILNSVIDETLRLFSAGAGPLPRLVPAEGAVVCGLFMPPGTVVSAPAYIFHRDTSTFPNPNVFDHTRFLPRAGASTKKSATAPFGGGTRVCIGMPLALMVVRRGAAEFFRRSQAIGLTPAMSKVELHVKSRVFATAPTFPRLDISWNTTK